MEKEVMGEILSTIFDGTIICCETPEQRNEIIRACKGLWFRLSRRTKALLANDDYEYPNSEYLCLILVGDCLHSYTEAEATVLSILDPMVSISSFFTSPNSDSSDFDKDFYKLIGG